jgi:hypothetical protein
LTGREILARCSHVVTPRTSTRREWATGGHADSSKFALRRRSPSCWRTLHADRRTRHAVFSFDERAANAEWKAGLQALFPGVELPPKTVFATEVNLTRVLDVSTVEIQRALRTNSAELAQPWRARNGPATQRLGLACFESGRFSALRYRSTKAAPSYCLAVFPSHMDSAEYVSVLDPQEFFSQFQLTSSKEI